MRVTDKHVFFYSWKDMFSNHYRNDRAFALPRHEQEGVKFYTGEHMMMYEKAMLFADHDIARQITEVFHPQEAKMLGRKVKGFNNALWEKSREQIVENVCYCRLVFDLGLRCEAIQHRLAGRSFVEASDRDRIWGVGLNQNHPMIHEEQNWLGLNLLGKAWDRATDALIDRCGGYDRVRGDFADQA
ncbi:NADAR family protein [Enterobacter hormaechei]|uniref:NADAR family protein n=1 Tax=Enterobacter hormaechei TaxID=158836 RepID=UPI00307617C1